MPAECKEPNCVRDSRSRGWCGAHYQRWWHSQVGHNYTTPMDQPIREFTPRGPLTPIEALMLIGGPAGGNGRSTDIDPVDGDALPRQIEYSGLCRDHLAVYERVGDPYWSEDRVLIKYEWVGWR